MMLMKPLHTWLMWLLRGGAGCDLHPSLAELSLYSQDKEYQQAWPYNSDSNDRTIKQFLELVGV